MKLPRVGPIRRSGKTAFAILELALEGFLEMTADRRELKQALRNWRDERDSAAVYEALASIERNPGLSRLFGKLAASEREHSAFWEDRLNALGHTAPEFRPSARADHDRARAAVRRRLRDSQHHRARAGRSG